MIKEPVLQGHGQILKQGESSNNTKYLGKIYSEKQKTTIMVRDVSIEPDRKPAREDLM